MLVGSREVIGGFDRPYLSWKSERPLPLLAPKYLPAGSFGSTTSTDDLSCKNSRKLKQIYSYLLETHFKCDSIPRLPLSVSQSQRLVE